MNISELKFVERPVCDPDKLVELCVQYGDAAAENIIARSIDQIVEALVEMETAYVMQNHDDLLQKTEILINQASKVGLSSIGRVGSDVLDCILSGDPTALAAVFGRLGRLADRSLNTPWDIQGISN